MLNSGADPNVRFEADNHNTALHVCRSPVLMTALLDKGAHPNAINMVSDL